MDKKEKEDGDDKLDQTILEGLSLCRGVMQRYIAYLQNMEPESLFPAGVQKTNEVGFKDRNNKLWYMKLDLVDDPLYKFPLEKCPGKAVQEMMAKIINNLHLVAQYVLLNDLDPEIKIPRPELIHNSCIAVTPLTSAFLYNKDYGREIHDKFPKRIAFVWSNDKIESV